MSFSTGTAPDRATLFNLFRNFAVASGWTLNRNIDSVEFSIQKTGKYGDTICASMTQSSTGIPAGTDGARIYLSMSDSYNAVLAWNAQPESPYKPSSTSYPDDVWNRHTSIGPLNAVDKYWFFSSTNPEFLAMVVLLPNSTYQHLVIGELERTDLTIGKGTFMYGTAGLRGLGPYSWLPGDHQFLPFQTVGGYWQTTTSWLRLITDERDGWWTTCRKTDGVMSWSAHGGIVASDYKDKFLRDNSLNVFSNSAALTPVNTYAINQTGEFSMLGHVPMWRTALRKAFIVDQVYTIGTDEWMAFPSMPYIGANPYSLVYRKIS